MIKINWGQGIAIFLIIYVGILVTALISSMRVDHSLVAKDYYAQDLAYQSRYEKESKQIAADNLSVQYNREEQIMTFQFADAHTISGSVHFYRPSNASHDFVQALSATTAVVSTKDMIPGKWKVKVDWEQDGQAYYKQMDMYL